MSDLIRYEEACRAVADAKTFDDVKDVRDKAAALIAYARMAKNKQIEVYGAEIRFRAERRLGEMIKEQKGSGGLATGGQPYQSSTPSGEVGVEIPTLSDAGIDYKLSSRSQAIADISEADFEAEMAQHREEQTAVTVGTMERLAGRAHVANNSGENEWYTPSAYIEAARDVMGRIDTDPASCDKAQETVKAAVYYTIENDGLRQQWHGNVWLNPPYAQPLIGQFIDALIASECDQAIVLVNNATETVWGSSLLAASSAVCFPRSRIRFIDKNGDPSGAPLQGQMFCYLGDSAPVFRREFSKFGVVFLG